MSKIFPIREQFSDSKKHAVGQKSNVVSFKNKTGSPVSKPNAVVGMPKQIHSGISFSGALSDSEIDALISTLTIGNDSPYNENAFIDITGLTKDKRIKGNFYNKLADNIAISLGSNNHVLLLNENDVDADLLIHNFTNNMEEGKYKGLGLNASYSDVFNVNDLDAAIKNEALLDGMVKARINLKKIYKEMMKTTDIITPTNLVEKYAERMRILEKQNPTEVVGFAVMEDVFNGFADTSFGKRVLFVKNYEAVIMGLNHKGISDANKYFSETFPNLSVVGILAKDKYKDPEYMQLATNQLLKKPTIDIAPLKNVTKLPLESLSIEDARTFLKTNPSYVEEVLKKYSPTAKFVPTTKAIDKAVEIASTKLDGDLVKTSLHLLDFVAGAKTLDLKAIYKDVQKPVNVVPLREKDIENLSIQHAEIVNSMKNPLQKIQLVENVKTRFKDVGGLKAAKEELSEEILEFAKNPKAYLASGKKAPGGRLLTGPPGTGKTLLARALAGEANVPFINMNGSDFGNSFINSGPMAVNAAFDRVEALAKKSQKGVLILFIDEIDSIAKKRSMGEDFGNGEDAKTTNALIARIDGFNTKESPIKIILIGASNRDEILDPALTDRPSRLGHKIKVDIPRLKSDRLEVLNIHAKKAHFASEAEKAKLLNEIAETTDGLNCDKLAEIVNEAIGLANKKKNKVIERKELFEGYYRSIYGRVVETDLSPEEIKLVRFHELGHAIANSVVKANKLLNISNEARAKALGITYFSPKQKLEDFSFFMKDIVISFAGGNAEKLLNKGHSTGVGSDYRCVTMMINDGITKYGMGVYTPHVSFVDSAGNEKENLVATYSKEIKKDFDLMSKTGQKISEKITHFYKDFSYDFIQRCDEGRTKDGCGKNISGIEFEELRNEWLTKNNKKEAAEKLEKWVDKAIELARTSNKKGFKKFLRYI